MANTTSHATHSTDDQFTIDIICQSIKDDQETTLDLLFPKQYTNDDLSALDTLEELGFSEN